MKNRGRVVKHLCHGNENDSHERCLVKIYKRYFELVSKLRVNIKANEFYFQPFNDGRFEFKNCAVEIHSFNNILSSLCGAIGTKRKTSHSLCVTCVTQLFNANVEEKLIRSPSDHVSDALLRYEKSCRDQKQKVSNILNPPGELKQANTYMCDAEQAELRFTSNLSNVRNDSEMSVLNVDVDSLLGDLSDKQILLNTNVARSANHGAHN